MNIVLIGPSGSGKGTCATQLSAGLGLSVVSTGELLRENLEARAAVGFLAKRYFARGELVPDEIVDAMVAERLWKENEAEGFLFDGFPRTFGQAGFLDQLLGELGEQLDAAIILDAPDDVIEERLTQRLVCQTCHAPYHPRYKPPVSDGVCDLCEGEVQHRPDDIPEMIRVRLRAFRRVVIPVVDYYEKSGRLAYFDARGDVKEVIRDVSEAIHALSHEDADKATGEIFAKSPDEWLADADRPELHESFDIVLIGGPGSGKGTQAEFLSQPLGLPHIASGDLFRDNIKQGTRLGNLAKESINQGALVPDDVTEAMVEERISRPDATDGFILDGFPRSLPQALALTEMLSLKNRHLDLVLYIRVSDEEILRRLSGRQICRECQAPFHQEFRPPKTEGKCDACGGELYCRDDDHPETIRARLKTFHQHTALTLAHYRSAGLLEEIDGEGDMAEVTERLKTLIEGMARPV
jgi:adenylate kinase